MEYRPLRPLPVGVGKIQVRLKNGGNSPCKFKKRIIVKVSQRFFVPLRIKMEGDKPRLELHGPFVELVSEKGETVIVWGIRKKQYYDAQSCCWVPMLCSVLQGNGSSSLEWVG